MNKEAINIVISRCVENKEWYMRYMNSNYERVFADSEFILENINKDSVILDVGGVPPLLMEYLYVNGYKNLCVADPNPEPFIEYFDYRNIKYYKTNVLDNVSEELLNRFDVVCLNEVVEHIAGNLLKAIENAIKCLKVGGILIVTTPNIRSIWGIVALLKYESGLATKIIPSKHSVVREQYERASSDYGYFGHIREYTPKEVIDLFESFGLKFYKKKFQCDYIHKSSKNMSSRFLIKLISFLEFLFPNWRLFGKYMFKKEKE
ncbi:class I SAM-dependent methyltransferase [Aliarcobacter butzleri]|uniref:class I SAM-dependent methyltransferase n=1 Tax=Aliarcobacter butzleri TaxID=28197 RepID=UPI0021B459E5|nr:class I SAM-dependent methyltransferase [Aliarcobacter butzleri]MCT7584807.1 class I SAM-dependent methyltransferase [Aliarcobacter butzleri]